MNEKSSLTVREALIFQGLQDVDLLLIELEKTRSTVTSSCEVVSANLAKQSETLRDSNIEFKNAINSYIKTVKQDISSYAENTKDAAQIAIKHDFFSVCQSIAAGVLKGNLTTQSSLASNLKIDKRLIYTGLTISVLNLILLIILLVR